MTLCHFEAEIDSAPLQIEVVVGRENIAHSVVFFVLTDHSTPARDTKLSNVAANGGCVAAFFKEQTRCSEMSFVALYNDIVG